MFRMILVGAKYPLSTYANCLNLIGMRKPRKSFDAYWTELARIQIWPIVLYGLIGGDMDSRRLYDTAVKWTKLHPEDADMLLTAGKLANRNSLWGKAQGYLESSIQHGGRREAFEELGQLLENQGYAEKAFDVYKKAALKSGR